MIQVMENISVRTKCFVFAQRGGLAVGGLTGACIVKLLA